MSRIKMLKDVADDVQALAESLGALVRAMESDEVEPAETERKVTLEEVRQALTEKSGSGYTAEVKALLMKHGGNKLSEIREEEYAALLADVEELG